VRTRWARAENPCADPDHGRSFGDRQRKIVCHSDRQSVKLRTGNRSSRLEEPATIGVSGSNIALIVGVRTDTHQSGQFDVRQGAYTLDSLKKIGRAQSELLLFTADIYL